MRRTLALAASALALGAHAAFAQDGAQTLAAAGAPQEGVTSYPASFFASLAPITAFDMITRLPGFTFDGGSDVRGYEGASGNVLVDGDRPVSKNDKLEDVLRRIPASAVTRIDVIRGGAPGVDMHGKTIIANIVRKGGAGFQGVAAVAEDFVYDGRMETSVRLEGQWRWADRRFEAAFLGGGGIDDGAGNGPFVRTDASGAVIERADEIQRGEARQGTFSASYEQPLLGGKLRLNAVAKHNPYHYGAFDFFIPPPDQKVEFDKVPDDQGEFGIQYSRALGARARYETLLLRREERKDIDVSVSDPSSSILFDLNKKTVETIARGAFKLTATQRLTFEAGGEAADNTLDSRTAFSLNGAPQTLPAANVTVEEKRWEGFATTTWRPIASLSLEAGLRYEHSTISSSGDLALEKSLSFAKPRAILTWSPDPKTQLRLRTEREVGQLNFDDFVASSAAINSATVLAGNPNLDPEHAWVYEAAFERRFWKGADVTITLRRYEISDVIDRRLFNGFDAPGNIGDGVKTEAAFDLTLPLDVLGLKNAQLKGVGVRRRSEVTDPTTLRTREISKLHPVDWEGHFTQHIASWRLDWGVDAFSGWRETSYRFDQIATDKLRTYVILFGEYKFAPDLSLRVEFDNFTERGFRHTLQVYGGPRNVSPLAFVDDRDIQVGRIYHFRLRKSF